MHRMNPISGRREAPPFCGTSRVSRENAQEECGGPSGKFWRTSYAPTSGAGDVARAGKSVVQTSLVGENIGFLLTRGAQMNEAA
jgi:hypothetical protein